jgi:hypothetical protein
MTDDRAMDMLVYEMATIREVESNSLMWQTPVLALTAQAFLLTIALGPDSTQVARFAVAALGAAVAFLSTQLMLKHRAFGDADAVAIKEIEDKYGLPYLRERKHPDGTYFTTFRGLGAISSHKAWVWLLLLFGLVNVLIIPVSIFWPSLLSAST